MDPKITLSLTVKADLIEAGRRMGPEEHVAFTADGRAYVIREIPNNPGRWLNYVMDGAVEPRSHSSDATISLLVEMAGGPPPSPAAGGLRRRWRRA